MDRRQVLFIDAINTSCGMTAIAYKRLQLTGADQLRSNVHTDELMLDAWSVVDLGHRLRQLIAHTPGLKQNSPGVQILSRALADLEDLRNRIQHLEGDIAQIAPTGLPALGTLAWVVQDPDGDDPRKVASLLVVPGTSATTKGLPMVNPIGQQIEEPSGLFELTAAGKTVSITAAAYAVATFRQRFARAVQTMGSAPERDDSKPARIAVDA